MCYFVPRHIALDLMDEKTAQTGSALMKQRILVFRIPVIPSAVAS
jgi:hypothetical protein